VHRVLAGIFEVLTLEFIIFVKEVVMIFLLAILMAQFNPASCISDFYSGRYFATGFLMKGPQELIQNPSYLLLPKNSHLLLNLSNFSDKNKLFVFGGNVRTEPLMEGGLIKIGEEKFPLANAFGTSGYFRKDTLQYEDADLDGSYDRAKLVKFEVNGDSTVFNLSALVGFQFVYENWFVSASFLKSQFNTQYQKPGDTLSNFGYFNYSMTEATYPDNRFVLQKIGRGDFACKIINNLNFVRLGGGIILSDSSFVSLLLGYKTSEERNLSDGYFSWAIDSDTTRRETHVVYDQGRLDEETSFTGRGYSLNFDYFLPKGHNTYREAGLFFIRDNKAVDNISKVNMSYFGNFNTVVDTFMSKYDSVTYSEENFTSSKGKTEDYFKAYYSEVFELNPFARFAIGINGYYRYSYMNLSYSGLDSLYVGYSDGDTVFHDSDDYERVVMQNKVGWKTTEEKEYAIQIPTAVEVNPFNLKGVTLWFGSLFNFTHKFSAEELKIVPSGEKIDSTLRGDSTVMVVRTPISQLRQRTSFVRENTMIFLTYGVSLEINENIAVEAYFRNKLNRFDSANFSVVIKF